MALPPAGTRLKALYGYRANNNKELTFAPGDKLTLLRAKPGRNWWLAISHQGSRGYIPSEYVAVARGICLGCDRTVYDHEERAKDAHGNYWHNTCFNLTLPPHPRATWRQSQSDEDSDRPQVRRRPIPPIPTPRSQHQTPSLQRKLVPSRYSPRESKQHLPEQTEEKLGYQRHSLPEFDDHKTWSIKPQVDRFRETSSRSAPELSTIFVTQLPCLVCGTDISETANFCQHCGSPTQASPYSVCDQLG